MDSYTRNFVVGVIAAIVVLAATFVFITGTYEAIPPDKVALHYTGGPIQGTHFVSVVQPGTGARFYGLAENLYELPSTQRTYIIDRDPNAGDKHGTDFIVAPSDDNVSFQFEVAVYFKLNMKPSVLRRFFEQVCLHDHCTDTSEGGGWDKMLAQYFRPQVENSVRLEAGKYDREQLYRDPKTLLTMQNAIGSILKDRINHALGGEFFCGPDSTVDNCTDFGFTIKNPTPPQSVVQAYADSAAASQNVVTQTNNAIAKAAGAKGDADAQNIRAAAAAPSAAAIAYIQAQAALACANSDGKCTMIVGAGTGVNVNTGP